MIDGWTLAGHSLTNREPFCAPLSATHLKSHLPDCNAFHRAAAQL